jgi:hypothetical protein
MFNLYHGRYHNTGQPESACGASEQWIACVVGAAKLADHPASR